MDATTIGLTILGLIFGVIGAACMVLWLYMRRGLVQSPRPSLPALIPPLVTKHGVKTPSIYNFPITSLLLDPKSSPIYIGPKTPTTNGTKGGPIYKGPAKETAGTEDALIRML